MSWVILIPTELQGGEALCWPWIGRGRGGPPSGVLLMLGGGIPLVERYGTSGAGASEAPDRDKLGSGSGERGLALPAV